MQQSLEWTSVIKIFGFSLSLSANIFFTTHDPAGSWRMVDYLTQCLPALAQSLFSFLTPVTGNYRFSRLISLRTNWKVLIRIHSKTLKGRVPESAFFGILGNQSQGSHATAKVDDGLVQTISEFCEGEGPHIVSSALPTLELSDQHIYLYLRCFNSPGKK